ncbi:hypothetical protein SAMN05216553_10999 [Lentzea fradiae]|uniref:Uncharacterized protein n=1 Tax=Lentzea fradiae TaxID=200378 RepID=A0A1G7V9L8_9PSEU|nr:hypothetical protein SAMN05216553_10999 [Lentzea fradiae]
MVRKTGGGGCYGGGEITISAEELDVLTGEDDNAG